MSKSLGQKFSVKKARTEQQRLSKLVIREDNLPPNIRYVAGVDVAYTGNMSIGSVAVLDFSTLSIMESQTASMKTCISYIPTLLSFRELSPARAAIRKLKRQPDIFLVDGQGLAHPYRLGFASHLGVTLDRPTIGVAKKILCGQVGPTNEKGWAPITHRGETIGASVSKGGKKPIYVSIGHKVSLETAIEIVRHCTLHYRIPEPIRAAHKMAAEDRIAPGQDE